MIFDRILLKYILAAAANFIVSSGIMLILYHFAGFDFWASSASNYIIGSAINFFLNKYWTFGVRKWSSYMIVTFFIINVGSYFLAYKLAKTAFYLLLANQSQWIRDNVALFAGMFLFSTMNYMGQRYIVFRKKEKRPAIAPAENENQREREKETSKEQ